MITLNNDWEFNVLGVYNYRKSGQFTNYFNFLVENHQHIPGDICEVGVYKGKSLLATALFLKEIGSDKTVWGFDSFEGFPTYHENDNWDKFTELYQQNFIDEDTYQQVLLNEKYRQLKLKQAKLTPTNISTSGDFSDTSIEALQEKIDFLGLDNIKLVKGSFEKTLTNTSQDYPSFAVGLVDCDLYESYKLSLPFIWQRLSQGGYIFLDEYYSLKFPGARIATDEFFADKKDKPQKHKQVKGEFSRWFVRKIYG